MAKEDIRSTLGAIVVDSVQPFTAAWLNAPNHLQKSHMGKEMFHFYCWPPWAFNAFKSFVVKAPKIKASWCEETLNRNTCSCIPNRRLLHPTELSPCVVWTLQTRSVLSTTYDHLAALHKPNAFLTKAFASTNKILKKCLSKTFNACFYYAQTARIVWRVSVSRVRNAYKIHF